MSEIKFSQAEISMALLWARAERRGREAAQAITPSVMRIVQADPFTGKTLPGAKVYVETEGPCGFAYVTIDPARGPLVSWLKKTGKGHKSYYGGYEVSIHDHGQSLERKSAHAKAMAEYLTAEGVQGISYYDRID
jgi:hypothetical protein